MLLSLYLLTYHCQWVQWELSMHIPEVTSHGNEFIVYVAGVQCTQGLKIFLTLPNSDRAAQSSHWKRGKHGKYLSSYNGMEMLLLH